jgi:hypothetical protein
MRPICAVVLATFLCAATTHAGADTHTRYLVLINRAHDSVTSLAVAAAGSDVFRETPLGAPLRGGGVSTTVGVKVGAEDESCLYDLRFTFRNGRTLIYQDVDICRYRRLRIQPPPRRDEQIGG